jgi:hypothetical protein
MNINRQRLGLHIVLACVVPLFVSSAVAQQTTSGTFVITVSLPLPIIHTGEEPLIKMTVANPTSSTVHGAKEYKVEILNESGSDIAPSAMGLKERPAPMVGDGSRFTLSPGIVSRITWHLPLEPGYLAPGVYKLRVCKLAIASQTDICSKAVTLTVVP